MQSALTVQDVQGFERDVSMEQHEARCKKCYFQVSDMSVD